MKLSIDNLSDVTYLQMNLENIFNDDALYQEVQKETIKKALIYHLENNPVYREYYDSFNIAREVIDESFDISDIPLLPSALFKRKGVNLLSVSEDEIIKFCTSSGTQGSISIVPRDEVTLTYFLSSISSTISSLFDLERTGNHKAFVLGPTPEESGDLWFSYVLSSLALSFNTEYFEHQGEFDVERAIVKLQEASKNNLEVFMVGPPFRIVELCQHMNQRKLDNPLQGNSFIISAGGWKNRKKETISKSNFIDLVTTTFKIAKTQVRDSYNMVELNSVLNECEYHQKHVLPWMDVCARDPKTNKALGDGEMGILSFYDGSSFSYPCFILSEDYGTVTSKVCRCGRIGKRVDIVKRMEGVESRGCALKMAISDEKIKRNNVSNRFYKSFFRDPDLFSK